MFVCFFFCKYFISKTGKIHKFYPDRYLLIMVLNCQKLCIAFNVVYHILFTNNGHVML